MLTVYICDDEPYITEHISKLIEESEFSFNIKVFNSGEELIESINEEIHIVFLDIQMKRVDGIDTAKALKERFPDVIIIFISGYFHYISETFTVNAFQFLLKPINETKFKKEFQRALDTYYRNHYKYRIRYKDTFELIDVQGIYSIETHGRRLLVNTANASYEITGKIKDELIKLEPYGFIRTHQGYIVNMAHIADYSKTEFILTNEKKIPISKHLREDVMGRFTSYIARIAI